MHCDFFDYITLIVSMASVVTAIVALITVLEMKCQREESHKPVITILPFKPIRIKEENGNISFNGEAFFSERIFMMNIGTGVAKNLSIQYLINYNTIISLINELCGKQTISFIGKNSIEFKSPYRDFNFSFLTTINDKDTLVIFDFIKNDEKKTIICLPSILNRLLSILFYAIRERIMIKKDWNTARNIESKPFPITMVLIYKDVGGKKYTERLKMHLSFSFIVMESNKKIIEENVLNVMSKFS